MADAAKSLKVFVSYSRTDVNFADQLVLALEDKGFEAILDRHDMSGGENWRERLGKLILSADAVAFILTAKSATSEICAWEVEEAHRLGKRILPVTPASISGVTPPAALGDLNWIPFYDEPAIPGSGFYYGVKRLMEALSVDLDWLRAQTRYSERAQEWSKARADDLLLRGEALKDAEGWLARMPSGAHPPDLVREYLTASGDAEQHRQAAAKAQLEEREQALKTAEAAVAERQAAIAEKIRSDRRLRLLAVSALAAGLVLVASALFGLWYAGSKSAEAGQRKADLFARTSLELLREGNRPLAMLMAVAGDPGANEGLFPGLFKPDGYPALRAALVRAHANDLLVSSMIVPDYTAFASLRDGRSFAIASGRTGVNFPGTKGRLQIWQSGSSEPTVKVDTDKVAIAVVALADGDGLLLVWHDNTASVWSISRKAEVRTLDTAPITGVAANIDGDVFVTSHADGKIRRWAADQIAPLEEYDLPEEAGVTTLAVDTEYNRIVAGLENFEGGSRLAAWEFGERAPKATVGVDAEVLTLMASDDMILAGLDSGRLVGWEGEDATIDGVQGFMGELGEDEVGIEKLAFSVDEGILMISTEGDAQFIAPIGPRPLFDGGMYVVDGGFLSAVHQVVTLSKDGRVQIWSLDASTEPSELINDAAKGYRQLGIGGGSIVISRDEKWKLRQAGGTFADVAWGPWGAVEHSAVSSDGTLFAASMDSGADLMLWRVGEAKPLLQLPQADPSKRTLSVHFQQGSTRFLTVSADGQIKVWEPGASESVATYPAPKADGKELEIMSFLADGERVLTVRSGHVELWRLGADVADMSFATTSVADAAVVDPSGQRIAIATGALLQVFSIDGKRLPALAGHKQDIRQLVFNKDGDLLLSSSRDGSLRLWRMGEREEVQRFDLPTPIVDAVDFDADGKHILVSLEGERFLRFPIDPIVFADVGEQVRVTCERIAERGLTGFTEAERDSFPILESIGSNNPCAELGYPVAAAPSPALSAPR